MIDRKRGPLGIVHGHSSELTNSKNHLPRSHSTHREIVIRQPVLRCEAANYKEGL